MTKDIITPFIKKLNQYNIITHQFVTGAVRSTSREKLYQKLGLQSPIKNLDG